MLDDRALAGDVGSTLGVVSLGKLAFHLGIALRGLWVLTQPVSEVDPVIEVRVSLGDDMQVVSSLVPLDPAKKRVLVVEPRRGSVLVAQRFEAWNRFAKLCDRPNLECDVDGALRHQPPDSCAADVMNTDNEITESILEFAVGDLELSRPFSVVLVEINRAIPHAKTLVLPLLTGDGSCWYVREMVLTAANPVVPNPGEVAQALIVFTIVSVLVVLTVVALMLRHRKATRT